MKELSAVNAAAQVTENNVATVEEQIAEEQAFRAKNLAQIRSMKDAIESLRESNRLSSQTEGKLRRKRAVFYRAANALHEIDRS